MLLTIFNALAPVLILILLGIILRATGFLSAEFFSGMNKLCYWVGLPALLFQKIVSTRISGGASLKISLVLLLGMLTCMAAGYLVAFLLRLPAASKGAFIQAAFRSNLAYVGLPIVLYTLASAETAAAQALEGLAVLAFAPLVPVYSLAAVLILSLHRKPGQTGVTWGQLWRKILGNPLVVACVIGFVFMLTGLPLPIAANRALQALGRMALPLTLLAIGASLNFSLVKGHLLHSLAVAAIKSTLAPAVGLVLATWLGMSVSHTAIALIFLACPTAVSSYIMAQQLDANHELAGSAIVVSTLLSFFPLAVVVGWALSQ